MKVLRALWERREALVRRHGGELDAAEEAETREAFLKLIADIESGSGDGSPAPAACGISAATVERWYQSHCRQRRSKMSNRPCPQVLGINEHFFTRSRGYATSFVDLKNHKVFDVTLGRS